MQWSSDVTVLTTNRSTPGACVDPCSTSGACVASRCHAASQPHRLASPCSHVQRRPRMLVSGIQVGFRANQAREGFDIAVAGGIVQLVRHGCLGYEPGANC